MSLNNSLKRICGLGLVFSLVGCGSTILRANFETNAVGTVPASELPGEPIGDVFYLSDPTSGSVTVITAPAGLSGKSLSYLGSASASYRRFLGFMGKETSASVKQYWAVWKAVPQLTENAVLDIWIGDGHFSKWGGIRLTGGQVLVANDISGTNYTPIGTYTNGRVQTVVMQVDKTAGTYAISVLGGPTTNTGRRPVITPGTLSATRPTVYFWYSNEAASPSSYAIDDVVMTEACPTDRGGVGVCP